MAEILRVFASVLLLACGVPALPQTAPNQSPRSLLVNVLDNDFNAVRDLTKDNFRVKVNGHPATLLEAHYNLAPSRIVVLLDMSGSMAGESSSKKWEIAHDAVEYLITETPADVGVALITFSSQVHDVFEFSTSRKSIALWLKGGHSRRADVKGRTALYDAVLAAAKLMEPARSGDAIYLITDGGENRSHMSKDATRKLLLQSGIRVFGLLFDEELPIEIVRDGPGPESVMELARETGGYVFGVSPHQISARPHILPPFPDSFSYDYDEHSRERIKFYTQALNVQLSGFYTLHLDAPAPARKPYKVALEVVDENGKAKKDVAWTYQQALPEPAK